MTVGPCTAVRRDGETWDNGVDSSQLRHSFCVPCCHDPAGERPQDSGVGGAKGLFRRLCATDARAAIVLTQEGVRAG